MAVSFPQMPAAIVLLSARSGCVLLAFTWLWIFAELKELIERCDALPPSSSQSGMTVFEADAELLNSVVRLLRLLDTPQHAKAPSAACPAGNPVSPGLWCFRLPAAGALSERQPVKPHCQGDRLDSRPLCRGFHGRGTGSSRGHEPIFTPPALQSHCRHDANSVSKVHPSSRVEEEPAL
jgi:AraC-type transcriptional regulator N-terminus